MFSDFEQIRRTKEAGQEYWTSRELGNALGYSTYQKFTRILNKAIAVANNKGMKTADHFNQTVEMVKLGSGTFPLSHMLRGVWLKTMGTAPFS